MANNRSSSKDPVALLDEADGHPQWLKEALEAIWNRLPPPGPPAPPATARPSWDPHLLAMLHLDPMSVPLTSTNRWYIAAWLKQLAESFLEGTGDEGDSHRGFTTLYYLGKTKPSSGPRVKRNGV